MNLFSALPFAAAVLGLLLAVASVLRKKPTAATWCFFAGMAILSFDSLVTGLSFRATSVATAVNWLTLGLVVKSFAPAAWLGFSLLYARGGARAAFARWIVPMVVLALLPIGLSVGFRDEFIEVVQDASLGSVFFVQSGAAPRALNVLLLVAYVLVLTNLEQTLRSAVGTVRWRIKYVVIGLAAIFGSQVYVRSQAVLFSVYDPRLAGVESSGLLIGCLLLVVAYARTGLAEADVYPSRAVLRSSLTVLVVGAYLFVVGVLAQVVRVFGGAESFHYQAFVVLLGMAGLTVLLTSDRFRQRVQGFVRRHFARAQHDSVSVWAGLSRSLANLKDEADLCKASTTFVSETFDVLTVTMWVLDRGKAQVVAGGSTAGHSGQAFGATPPGTASDAFAAGLRDRSAPFDLESVEEEWAKELRQLSPATFPMKGGNRWCVPLAAGEQRLGALVLADRVNAAVYTVEELELLKSIGDQVASVLLNLRLAKEVVQAKELEAFRTMSAFFVHDLKNAAASLNLTLKNLPLHFDNPAFREDALRAVGNTARRIDEMIARLSALRQRPQITPVETDLNLIVAECIDELNELGSVELVLDLHPVPLVLADRDQIRSVVTNLLVNARDAVSQEGRIAVRTERQGGRVVLSVADNGCGMTEAFVEDRLFRPFQSTKRDGLGIGMFQSRMIVEAHRGTIHVESGPGKGTTFRVSLPGRIEA